MKIAILHMTIGLARRGSENVTEQVAEQLAKHHTLLVLQSGPVTNNSYPSKRVMPLSVAPAPAPVNFFDKLLFRLHLNESAQLTRRFTSLCYRELKSFDPDIVIAVNGSDQIRLLRGIVPRAKVVVFGHAGIGHDDQSNLAAHPDLFVALTKPAESWAHSLAKGDTKVAYIPNPINLAPYEHSTPYKHNLVSPVVLVVGALSTYKNIGIAVAAAKSLSASLLLVGDGEEASAISDQLSSYGTDFRWLKSVEPDMMPQIYRSADAFCFVPNRQEAFGQVYLEAMAASLPIVASDDPIRRSIVGDRGYYADPHDVSSTAKALESALKHGSVSYTKELESYAMPTVITSIEEQLNAIV